MLAAVGTRGSTIHSSPLLGSRYGSKPRRHLSSSRAIDSKVLNNSALSDVPKPLTDSCSACVSPLRDSAADNVSVLIAADACRIRTEPFDDLYEVHEELGRFVIVICIIYSMYLCLKELRFLYESYFRGKLLRSLVYKALSFHFAII